MSNVNESTVQVEIPSTSGKIIRNLNIQTYVDFGDGNGPVPTTVQMQVVGIVDESGNVVPLREQEDWRRDVLDELRAIRIGIQEILEDSGSSKSGVQADPLIDQARDLRNEEERREN